MSWQLIFQLLFIAAFVGSIPLMYSALKGNTIQLQNVVWVILFFTFDLILFGAFTRLTDSGLGCPDWPGCYGHSNPILAMDQILDAQHQMPFGPVTVTKAWIEMLHRYFASGVGFLIVCLVAITWLKRATFGRRVFYFSCGLFFLVSLQGAFGALTVTMRLQPLIVTSHLMLALILVISLTAPTEVIQIRDGLLKPKTYSLMIPIVLMCIVATQIFLGAWVSTNYAVLACLGFPQCNGEWIPQMDFMNGFTWWRELGRTASGEFLNTQALMAIHWTHRVGALIITLSVTLFLVFFHQIRHAGNVEWNARASYWKKYLLLVLCIQLVSGVSNVIFQWPMIVALIHTGGSAALLIGLTKLTSLSLYPSANQ